MESLEQITKNHMTEARTMDSHIIFNLDIFNSTPDFTKNSRIELRLQA